MPEEGENQRLIVATYGQVKKRSSGIVPLRRQRPRTLGQAVQKAGISRVEAAKFLVLYGRELQKEVKLQAQRELSSNANLHSIGDISSFLSSLKVKVDKSTLSIEIVTNYPNFDKLLEGTDPFPMTWLTQEKGVKIVPLKADDGTVVFRTTPLKSEDAWIHPGIARHTFLNKAFDRARRKCLVLIRDFIAQHIIPKILS